MAKAKKKGQRADGRIEIKRRMPDGTYRHFYGTSRAKCDAQYQAAIFQMAQAAERAATGPMFADLAQEWWEAKSGEIRHGTIRCYKPAVNRLKKAFKGKRAKEITAEDVSRMMQEMKTAGLATSTIGNTHSVLTMIFEFAAIHYGLQLNPSDLVSTPTGAKAKRKPPSEEQEIKIKSAISEAVQSGNVTDGILMAAVFLYTGARRGEALALQYRDVDREQKQITIRLSVEHQANQPVIGAPKTENGFRILPLLPQLCAVLDAHGWGEPEEYLLGGATKPMTNRQFFNRWISFCRVCGLAEASVYERTAYRNGQARRVNHTEYKAAVTPHQFRHWYATELYNAGIPMEVAIRMMGHADSEMIRRVYLDINRRMITQAGERLATYMEKS